jgi:hypothetical protein
MGQPGLEPGTGGLRVKPFFGPLAGLPKPSGGSPVIGVKLGAFPSPLFGGEGIGTGSVYAG